VTVTGTADGIGTMRGAGPGTMTTVAATGTTAGTGTARGVEGGTFHAVTPSSPVAAKSMCAATLRRSEWSGSYYQGSSLLHPPSRRLAGASRRP
jgi:hypothetical protein